MTFDRRVGGRSPAMTVTFGFAVLSALSGSAAAQADADIETLLGSFAAAFNQCDADAIGALLHPDYSGFGASGSLGFGPDDAVASFQANCDRGLRFDMSIELLESAAEGNAAFAAALAGGTLTLESGEVVDNPMRLTLILARETSDGPLLVRHIHLSGLR